MNLFANLNIFGRGRRKRINSIATIVNVREAFKGALLQSVLHIFSFKTHARDYNPFRMILHSIL